VRPSRLRRNLKMKRKDFNNKTKNTPRQQQEQEAQDLINAERSAEITRSLYSRFKNARKKLKAMGAQHEKA